MTAFVAGSTFRIDGDPHLWVLVSDDRTNAVWFNFTTFRPNDDQTVAYNDPSCIVWPGEHGYVQHVTSVYYYGGHCASLAQLEKREASRQLRRYRENVNPPLLAKIRDGAAKSRFTPNDCYVALSDQGLLSILSSDDAA